MTGTDQTPKPGDTIGVPVGTALLFATGFTEAYVYLRQGHVFAQAMTGNLVLIGAGAIGASANPFWYPLVVFCAFICGTAAMWASDRYVAGPGDRARDIACGLTLGLLAGVLLAIASSGQSLNHPWAAVAVAFCGGLEIAAFRHFNTTTVTTVVMTSNTYRAVDASLDALFGTGPVSAALTLIVSIGAFALGALGGAWASEQLRDNAGFIGAGLFLVTLGLYLWWPRPDTAITARRAQATPSSRATPR